MISNKKVEDALDYLATSAEPFAQARGLAVYLEEKRKILRADAFKRARAGGDSVAYCEAVSMTDTAYKQCVEELKDAITEETLFRARREAAGALIEMYRTQESSRRAANIV